MAAAGSAAQAPMAASAPKLLAPSPSLNLFAQKPAWLAAQPVVRVGVDPAFAPYAFFDAQGRPAGAASEITERVARCAWGCGSSPCEA